MHIKYIKVGELEEFVGSDLYESLHEIPITCLRAISMMNNPRASSEDLALIIAYKNSKLMSYVGLLSDWIWIDGKPEKMYWNSGWWVNKEEQANVAAFLFYAAVKSTNGKLYFNGLTNHTAEIIRKMKNFTTFEQSGFRGYLNMDIGNSALVKNGKFSFLRPFIQLADKLINTGYLPKKYSWNNKLISKKISYKIVPEIDDEIAGFIKINVETELFRRNKTELNWIKNNPWITTENLQADKKYHFTLQVKSFEMIFVKILNNNELIGFFVLLEVNKNAQLMYCYFSDSQISVVANTLFKVLLDRKNLSFTSFDSRILQYTKTHKNPFIFVRDQKKICAFPVSVALPKFQMQHGDGDCAFV